MALTGALQADFSAFVSEAHKASAALGVMDAEAKKTGATLAKTGAVMDGMGTKSGAGLTQISAGLRTVDQSANALGFSLAKPIGMLDELGQVAGKTTAELGALGTAGAVAGAALAGWNVGRWIADLTGSDDVIGRLTARVLGIGDAAEVAGYKQDLLARASATAGRTITDLSEAMTINYNAVQKAAAAVDTATHRQALWEGEIRKHRAVLPEISAALANHTGTVAQLAKQYGMTAEAITYYVQKTKTQSAAHEEAARKTEAAAAAQKKLRDSLTGADDIKKAQEYMLALQGIGSVAGLSAKSQSELNRVIGEGIEAYTRAGQVAPQAMRDTYIQTIQLPPVVSGLTSEWANVGTQVTITADSVVADTQRMKAETEAFERETQDMVQAYIDMQYGIEGKKKKTDEDTDSVKKNTQAYYQLNAALGANRSALDSVLAGHELMSAYAKSGVAMGSTLATGGYDFSMMQRAGLPTTNVARGLVTPPASSNQHTLNINVNNSTADDLAKKLTTEMRHQGVRF
jgi:ParB-like chromosome segregation protein Spo0J